MFGFIRFFFRVFLLIAIVAAVVGYFTNPTKADFAEKAERVLRDRLSGVEGFDTYIEDSTMITRQLIEGMVGYRNYYVCGVFTVNVPFGPEYRFLGVFGQFIPLQRDNPFEYNGQQAISFK